MLDIRILNVNDQNIAEIISEGIVFKNRNDAIDIIVNSKYEGAAKIIVKEENIIPAFFDLSTSIARDSIYMFSMYAAQLAIVSDLSKYKDQDLLDFIKASNEQGEVFFVSSMEEAKEKLAGSTELETA